jgi:hypothetical protein
MNADQNKGRTDVRDWLPIFTLSASLRFQGELTFSIAAEATAV